MSKFNKVPFHHSVYWL